MNILTTLLIFLASFNHEPIKVGCGELTVMVESKHKVLIYEEDNLHLNIPEFTYDFTGYSIIIKDRFGVERLILSPDYNLIVNK